jgi:carbon starvation protein
MTTFLIAVGALVGYLIAYHTYGRWLARRIFKLDPDAAVPSVACRDDRDFVPTSKGIVFGHHFTSIAGTGPIVGPAIAVMWGWLPALLWVLIGSVFIGAVHDFGALVVSLRNRGQTVGDIAGRVLNKRVRLLFLLILFMALTIVLAIFGLVIAAVFKQFPAAIFPCLIQIPIAVGIGLWLHQRGVNLTIPSLLALAFMYLTVVFGDWGPLHTFNTWAAGWPIVTWVAVLLSYSYIASVLPVWTLLQPRDYINSLQLITALALVMIGLCVTAFIGGAPPVEGAERQAMEIAAPMWRADPPGAPMIWPFLFITIACGACSGFHCLVSSGTSSKQLRSETDAQAVGYGSMLTEGFLATLVILACVAGLGLGIGVPNSGNVILDGSPHTVTATAENTMTVAKGEGLPGPAITIRSDIDKQDYASSGLLIGDLSKGEAKLVGKTAYDTRYASWQAAGGLAAKVGAFVDGAGNFLKAMGIPAGIAVALMGVLVASFAGTTLDTATRLQRYVVQELAGTFGDGKQRSSPAATVLAPLRNMHGATIFAVVIAGAIAALPAPGSEWTLTSAGKGGLILWPLFGATNQLLAGLAFLVICFWMWRRKIPVWFVALPMLFMLVMPAWAMLTELPRWIDDRSYLLVGIGGATIALEAWMIVEAALMWPRVKGKLEDALPPLVASTS